MVQGSFGGVGGLFGHDLVCHRKDIVTIRDGTVLIVVAVKEVLRGPQLTTRDRQSSTIVLPYQVVGSTNVTLVFATGLTFQVDTLLRFGDYNGYTKILFQL